MDEQQAHEQFERLVGGPDRGFRLLRIYRDTSNPVSLSILSDWEKAEKRMVWFKQRATADGYTLKQIGAFLHLQGVI